ncbi:hypothetical protein DV737_g4705, partial [Chaetothyriales sp. CBS 132003]
METDAIDSHLHLGINSKREDRLTYRRRTNCTVLNSTDYVTGWEADPEADDLASSRQTTYAFFGPSNYKQTNWTYSYSNFSSLYDNFTVQVMLPYQIDAEMSYGLADPQVSFNDFDVIPDLAQDSADVMLVFLSFTGMYTEEINDPCTSATPVSGFRFRISFEATTSTSATPVSGFRFRVSFEATPSTSATPVSGFRLCVSFEAATSASATTIAAINQIYIY